MNNLLLAGLVFVSSAAFWLVQHAALLSSRTASLGLTEQIAGAQNALRGVTDAATRAQSDLSQRRSELKPAESELESAARDAQMDFPTPPLDPQHEGAWPTNRPYFYLAKKYLGKIGYQPLSQEHRLTSAGETLFGMTPAERNAVDHAVIDYFNKAHELQAAHAEPVTPAPGVNSDNHRETSFKLPPLTNEVSELRTGLDASVQSILGNDRAGLLLDKADEDLDKAYAPYSGHAYTVTLSAERRADGSVFHQIKLDVPGMGTMYMPTYFPLTPDSALWGYRHLFGDQPLIPLPSDAGRDK